MPLIFFLSPSYTHKHKYTYITHQIICKRALIIIITWLQPNVISLNEISFHVGRDTEL